MKEFVDKLIGRLEEVSYNHFDLKLSNAKEIVNQLAEEYKSRVMIDNEYCWQKCSAVEHCKECSRLGNGTIDYFENYDSLAEEYNNGWILCSSGNFSTSEVLVCKEDGTIDFDVFDFMYGDWKFNSNHHKNKVIAWMPLPQPYKEENTSNTEWKQHLLNRFEGGDSR